jgi:hypothetical protein
MGIFAKRRARVAKEKNTAELERIRDPRNVVSAMKQCWAEDPGYKDDIIRAMLGAKEEADERGKQFAADYFGAIEDPQEQNRRKTYGLLAGKALADITDAVLQAAESNTDDTGANEAFMRQIGQALLELADEAYVAGSISLEDFRQGALATNDPEFGTLIAWERAKEAGMGPEQIDRISYIYQQLNEGGYSNS